MGPEARLERKLREAVTAAGGKCLKLVSAPGMPDRLIILPGPTYVFAEMKAASGRLSRIQKLRIRELESLGCDVCVVKGPEETEAFVSQIREHAHA